jgi:hypothetical protein
MERITIKHLDALVARLNYLTNSPMKPYEKGEDGRIHAQIGNYHISQAYGGVCLHRMHNDGGGVTTPLSGGHIPKRELYEQMHAFIRGIELGKGA